MVGLEVTAGARLTEVHSDEIRALGTRQSQVVADLIDLDLTWAEEWGSDGVREQRCILYGVMVGGVSIP